MNIVKSLRLEPKDYIPEPQPKDLIVLHHTVGGTVQSTVEYWRTDPRRVATAYLVERDGTIFEVFDPECWAFHLGLAGTAGSVDKRSIGIEIASEGGLTERGGKLYCFDIVSDRTLFNQEVYDHHQLWRGYRFFDAYSASQLNAVCDLVDHLCEQLQVPRVTPANHFDFDERYTKFIGVVGHHHLRSEKSDVHPGFAWQQLVDRCRLQLV